jgi:ABC-2 type transport system permease protein
MSSFSLFWLLLRTQLQRSLSPRRVWMLAALAILPTLIALVFSIQARKVTAIFAVTNLAWFLSVQLVVPLVSLLAGMGVLAREVEDRTLTYLFTRPLSRAVLFLARSAGAMLLALLLNGLGAVGLLWAAARIRPEKSVELADYPLADWSQDGVSLSILGAVALGSVVYTAVFACISVFTRHPMIVGLVYTFAIESFLSNLPGSNQALTLQYYLRSWIAGHGSPAWNAVEGFAVSSYDPALNSALRLLIISGLLLGLAAWRIRRKEFVFSA